MALHVQAPETETAQLSAFKSDVLAGLRALPKRLSSKYFYDDAGSELFRQIMGLPSYYLTEAERSIFKDNRQEIVAAIGTEPFNLIELGAGDGSKTAILLEALLDAGIDVRYVPIDISQGALTALRNTMTERLPGLQFAGIQGEWSTSLAQLSRAGGRKNVVFFLGSNIGNLTPAEAEVLLGQLVQQMRKDDLFFLGADLKKDPRILQAAYDDPQGVTKAFNLNLLTRINRELEADIKLDSFQHHAIYDPDLGAMESFLLSTRAQTVFVGALNASFQFAAWEPLHLEYSYKYTLDELNALANAIGCSSKASFQDALGYFADVIWQVS